jgi:hypothetical protein
MVMTDKKQVDIGALIRDEAVVIEALRKGAREAMKRHMAVGAPMMSRQDGDVVEIPTEKSA